MSNLDSTRLCRGDHHVMVEAPARLHLGFVDLHGGMGRRFGSVGLAVEGPMLRVTAKPADQFSVKGIQSERAYRLLQELHEHTPLPGTALHVEGDLPFHQGLGAGTQLAMSINTAVSRLHGIALSPRQAARILDRGAQSGIGLATFEHGGFVVDGGRGTAGEPPPLISRLSFPRHWRVILVMDTASKNQPGWDSEAARKLAPFPPALADRLCRELLMRALPAVAEEDMENFGRAITEIQRCVGDYFAPVQGGRYASPRVAAVLERFETLGAQCVGQSAWGPTGFAIVEAETFAHMLVRDAKEVFGRHLDHCELRIVTGRNHGAQCTNSWQPRLIPTPQ